MDQTISKIIKIYMNYTDSPRTIDYINTVAVNNMIKDIEHFHKKTKIIINMTKNAINIYKNFLSDSSKQFFYVENTNIFIFYNNTNFSIITEDNIWHLIHTELSNHPILLENKNEIRDKIIEKIKK